MQCDGDGKEQITSDQSNDLLLQENRLSRQEGSSRCNANLCNSLVNMSYGILRKQAEDIEYKLNHH